MAPKGLHTNVTARAWQRMLSGRRLDLLDPSPMDIEVEDIAHGLARVARWNGQTVGEHGFSVAQHSLIVADLVPKRLRLAALLHDAAEAYMGDMVKPLKQLFPMFSDIEAKVMSAIGLRFGVGHFSDKAIKRADLVALAMGKAQFYRQIEMGMAAAYQLAGQTMACNMMDKVAQEGVQAFIDKRKPSWRA